MKIINWHQANQYLRNYIMHLNCNCWNLEEWELDLDLKYNCDLTLFYSISTMKKELDHLNHSICDYEDCIDNHLEWEAQKIVIDLPEDITEAELDWNDLVNQIRAQIKKGENTNCKYL